jgi:hypothetical protein
MLAGFSVCACERLNERQLMEFELMLPEHPKPDQYNTVDFPAHAE